MGKADLAAQFDYRYSRGTKMKNFSKYAWFVLLFNLFIIIWGAFVRASGSGAGCGDHWPKCNGEIIPMDPSIETIIEFTHRATSGLALIFVVILFFWARRLASPRVLFYARNSLIFIIIEALLGAGLVLLGLVDKNETYSRALVMSIHLVNTFFLIAAILLTAYTASFASQGHFLTEWKSKKTAGLLQFAAVLAMVLLGVSGAVTALGDTLYPATTWEDGLAKTEISTVGYVLLRLRILHPLLALTAGAFIAVFPLLLLKRMAMPRVKLLSISVIALVAIQIVCGYINIILMAPVYMQLIHLALADLLWLSLVALIAAQNEPVAQHA